VESRNFWGYKKSEGGFKGKKASCEEKLGKISREKGQGCMDTAIYICNVGLIKYCEKGLEELKKEKENLEKLSLINTSANLTEVNGGVSSSETFQLNFR
jgi:hypothetical protein